ncbi:peptide/nickel transport system substrate-binding protein [Variovorax boronicumulans]|uniref:ABC transporter substrate-binding protein n=1 Tax=Variovorax boronicumulans TaxID=436515 RepID=UPI00278B60CE|nr:ABC transporter substrate-binding protein [Variovorax boronicumulans]MDQ0034831.1 peptide/nickel transport system substrate-binding protein [Variovorax boronicumulans]
MAISLSLRRAFAAALPALALSFSAAASAETVLRTVPSSDLKILDPIWTTANITRNHGLMIYDTLFGMDEKGVIKPQMVEKYTASPDNKVWTFTLRPGLKFHDGAPVTSQDVIASLARWAKRDTLGQKMYEAMDSIVAEGPNGFRMTFKQPFGVVLDALGKPNPLVPFIMPRRVAETPADKQIEEMIGSGPFTLAKADFRPGDRVIYRKNAAYVPRKDAPSGLAGGKVVNVDRVEWVLLRDPQTQVNALLNGEVDMLEGVPASGYTDMRTNPKIELVDVMPAGPFTAIYNHKVPPFNNPKALKAAMLAINQEAMLRAQATFRDFYKPCASIYLCGSMYSSDKTGFFTGKPQFEEARKLLKESGYDGKPVVILLPGDAPALNKMPAVYGQLLKQVGFNVDVQTTDWATLVTRRTKKDLPENGGWNVFITFWGGVDASNPISYGPLTGNGDKGFFGWPNDPELEALKSRFIETTDLAQRKDIATQIQLRVLEGGVIAPLGEGKAPTAVRRGVVSGLLPSPAVLYWNVRKN